MSFLENRVLDFRAVLSTSFWTFLVMVILVIIGMYRAAPEMHHAQQQTIQEKIVEIQELKEALIPKQLTIFVEHGTNISRDAGGGIPKMTLNLDVVNTGTKKILDLEAHFGIIDQVTESSPDDWSITNGYLSYRTKRLQWANGKFAIDLAPGFPETKLMICFLDCSNFEFRIIHEGVSGLLLDLQKNSLYRVNIRLRGKLEGENSEYRFFNHTIEFMCLPKDCRLEHITETSDLRDIPDGLRRKIRPITGIES